MMTRQASTRTYRLISVKGDEIVVGTLDVAVQRAQEMDCDLQPAYGVEIWTHEGGEDVAKVASVDGATVEIEDDESDCDAALDAAAQEEEPDSVSPVEGEWNIWYGEGRRAYCVGHSPDGREAHRLALRLGAAQLQFGLDGEVEGV